MNDLLHSPKAKVGAAVAGGLILVLAAWFLLVSPQRAKANELTAEVSTSRAELRTRQLALATPSATVRVKPSDLYRLTKALPNDTDMAGILLDVNRLAARNKLAFRSITPAPSVSGTGYLEQPLAVVVQGRFGNISHFLGDVRTLVSVRGQRLDARGRLYCGLGGRHHRPGKPEDVPDREGRGDPERLLVQRPDPDDHP